VFDVSRHYTLETILCEIPRLCGVASHECIPKALLVEGPQSLLSLPVFNEGKELEKSSVSAWLTKAEKAHDNIDDPSTVNIQVKSDPWKQLLLSDPDVGSLSLRNKATPKGDLIVVASLIDRAPNLGGLCRTCEIMGVRQLVLNNKKITQDHQFQSLSVSADRWVNIEEVRVYQLKQFLLSMKTEGYMIVGIEQSQDSSSLSTFDYPKKTLLLLGNEKEGIPVEYLQLLDRCIEIPQAGLIRSLNVHVTGALCIWEYAKQHVFSKNTV